MQIAILGGGISGLAASYYLRQLLPEARLTLLEAGARLGGVLRTEREGDYLIECAADNFLRGPTAPWAESLCDSMGFASQLIPTHEANRGAHIVWRGQLIPIPAGFQLMAPSRLTPILQSKLLSLRGRLRLCLEPLIREPRELPDDESLTQFATRRLGKEAFERLVQPLVSGIYTADPDRLSVRAALPQMVEMVQQHGSMYRAMRKRQQRAKASGTAERGARYGLFVAPRQGMQQWLDALTHQLADVDIRLNCAVESIRHAVTDEQSNVGTTTDRWALSGATLPDELQQQAFDGVVLALPATRSAQVVQQLDPALGQQLGSIRYASSAVVAVGYRRDQIARKLDAFGSVVPRSEGRSVLAISYGSLKFPDRAPDDRVLMRVFLGGALQPELMDETDAQLIRRVEVELQQLLGVQGSPELCRVIRWPQAMPQYDLGHLETLKQIETSLARHPGLCLAGNGYEGVGIPQCVRSGKQAAERLSKLLSKVDAPDTKVT